MWSLKCRTAHFYSDCAGISIVKILVGMQFLYYNNFQVLKVLNKKIKLLI